MELEKNLFLIYKPILNCCQFGLIYNFVSVPPMIWIPNQLIGASIGGEVTLDCNTEAFPLSLNYWTKEDNYMIVSSDKFKMSNTEKTYKVHMKLTIKNIEPSDFGISITRISLN